MRPEPLRYRNLERLEPLAAISIGIDIERRRAGGESILDLATGEPDFHAPRGAVEAGIRAIQQGKVGSVAGAGILDLRAGAARYLSLLSGGRPVNADNVLVSNNEQQALFNACFALFSVGDEVLIAAPSRAWYPGMIQLARGRAVLVPGDLEWSLKVGLAELDAAVNAQTRGLLLCTPVNPTGAVYTRSELNAILSWAAQRGLWVVCEESYRRIHFGSGPAPSVLDLPDEVLERVVMVSGTGLAYAMRGWSVGLTLARRSVIESIALLQTHTASNAAHPAQWGAAAIYSDERVELEVDRMVSLLRTRRDSVVEHFRCHMPGVEFVEPLGAYYFFFRVDSVFGRELTCAGDFCERLLADTGVALLPGGAFGDDRWARLCYSVHERTLAEALPRISEFTSELAARSDCL